MRIAQMGADEQRVARRSASDTTRARRFGSLSATSPPSELGMLGRALLLIGLVAAEHLLVVLVVVEVGQPATGRGARVELEGPRERPGAGHEALLEQHRHDVARAARPLARALSVRMRSSRANRCCSSSLGVNGIALSCRARKFLSVSSVLSRPR